MYKVRVMELPNECWIHSNREYILNPLKEFPTVKDEYECVLKKNGIPYKKGRVIFGIQYLEYWNPSLYEEKEITGPLFAFLRTENLFCYAERNYTGKVPTQETYEKAWEIKATVDKLIKDYIQQKKQIAFAQRCKASLNGEKAVGIEFSNLEASGFEDELDMKFEGEHIKYIRFLRNRHTSCAVIFNMSRIEPDSVLTMKVPKGKEGLFVGVSGFRVKYWSEMLGVRRINVVS